MSSQDVSMPDAGTPDPSGLASAVPTSTPQAPSQVTLPAPNGDNQSGQQLPSAPATAQPTGVGGRLSSVLGAIAKIALPAVMGGLAGQTNIGGKDGTRASFGGGLAGGAKASIDADDTAQKIKFANFDSMNRAAQLHNESLRTATAVQAGEDEHVAAQDKIAQSNMDYQTKTNGTTYTFVPDNDGAGEVSANFDSQQKQNGSVNIPSGSIHKSGGFYIPNQGSADLAQAQTKDYNGRSQFWGMNPVNTGVVSGTNYDAFMNKLSGRTPSGDPMHADDMQNSIDGAKQALATYQKSPNADPGVIKQTQDDIQNLQAKQQTTSARESAAIANAAQQKSQGTEQGKINAQMTPQGKALDARNQANKMALQQNAQDVKPAPDTTELNAVAYDPNYKNPDGSTGGNVVMSKADAAAKGLQHYKVDVSGVNSLVAGFNDVQNKINGLASIANDPSRMSQVDPGLAARMLAHGKGVTFGASGLGSSISIDTSRINEEAYAHEVQIANQATKDYVTAFGGAHEAITQLPRLQTFGKSSRMTQQQMEAAQNLLPQPGDGTMAGQKMVALQQMLDPLRKQIPNMPGAVQIPSWMQSGQKQAPQQAPQQVGSFNPQTQSIDYTNLP